MTSFPTTMPPGIASKKTSPVHLPVLLLLLSLVAAPLWAGAAAPPAFIPLQPIAELKVIAAAEAFSSSYRADNLLQPATPGGRRAEYASRGAGTRTFVDFDLGHPRSLAGFRHVQRRTSDSIAEANLVFSNSADFAAVLATVKIRHVDQPGATTFASFPPVTARYVRWQVTSIEPGRSRNSGGQSIEFFTNGAPEAKPAQIGLTSRLVQVVKRQGDQLVQPLVLNLHYPYANAVSALVRVEGQAPRPLELSFGNSSLEFTLTAVDTARTLQVAIEVAGRPVATHAVALPPARRRTVFILPHSHTDIGYTAIQTDIEEKQINNLLQGLADARRTSGYPAGARFVWNVEVLWAADLFLQRLSADQRAEFFAAVRNGQIALNGMYLNELTGLCRPEELLRLFRYATQLGEQTGAKVDSAMISDVPGYTWGTVTAMAQAGIRYFSVAPNYFDRIGDILVQWENKPFWWIGPDGQSKVLVWIPFWGYAMSHRYGKLSEQLIEEFCDGLESRAYPYDIAYVRWAGHGDNAVPDPVICDFVKEWNSTHAWPQFVISSTSDAFRAFEKRYGDQLPQVRGDWTPYWEDGAGSSAAETALNRASSERLAQAETLWAMLDPGHYPAKRFEEAWNNVLLYSEHTWGAYCSITQPASPFTSDQWNIKQSYATTANLQSRQLLATAAQVGGGFQSAPAASEVDVFNTSSWPRSEVVLVPHELSAGGASVTDAEGRPVPAQRLASRELAILVRDLPPFSGRRYTINRNGKAPAASPLRLSGPTLDNELLRVRLDERNGAIVELRAKGIASNLVDTADGGALNEYLYFVGDNLAALQRSGPVKITPGDRGPLVASLVVESEAPGCHRLRREVRLIAGADHVEVINTVDKQRLRASDYRAGEGKESVNFAFPFNVPDGEIRLDVPFGVFRPETDQIPSACKNWLTVGRWADVANANFGVTWVTVDEPLVQVGELSARLLNSQTDPAVWRKRIAPTQKIYAWAMNNHWGTNYRAFQEGPVVFRFLLRPHRGTTAAEASRFATNCSQPLIAAPARGRAPASIPRLEVAGTDVLVTAFKPTDDGGALIVRLLGTGTKTATVKLRWSSPEPSQLWLSDTSEKPLRRLAGDIAVPPWGLVTIRADLPK